MKVIDLLNKIANGEEVPKKIKCLGIIHEYCEINKFYYTEGGSSLYREMFTEGNCLDDEIEIIEEDKEIRKLPPYKYEDEVTKLYLAQKIDELIDEINKLKKGK